MLSDLFQVDSLVPCLLPERWHAPQTVYAIGRLAHNKAIRPFCLVLRREEDDRPP